MTHYSIDYSKHTGWNLVAELANGDGVLLGVFPTKAEAVATRDALRSLRKGR